MGTQFSKVKLTQRVELHSEVFGHCNDGDGGSRSNVYDVEQLPHLFTRRSYHAGVLSGHELLSYSFVGGSACEPRRSLRRVHRSTKSLYSSFRSSSMGKRSDFGDNIHYVVTDKTDAKLARSSDLNLDSIKEDVELDSGISLNVNNYEEIRERRILKSEQSLPLDDVIVHNDHDNHRTHVNLVAHQDVLEVVEAPEPLPSLTDALRRLYRNNFSDWFEPGTSSPVSSTPFSSLSSSSAMSSSSRSRGRSKRRRSLHQKLVLSQMNTKRATKLDMDDRAKIVNYFAKSTDLNAVESVKIEDMFGTCWAIPMASPAMPTVITVQAPAGIGKSSMLKYMCMKWGCRELWASNFDALLFIECRTLNRLGAMTGRQFMQCLLEPLQGAVRAEHDDDNILDDLSGRAAAGRVLILLDGLDEVHDVANLASITMPAGHPDRPGKPGKNAADAMLTPLQFAQCLLTGALLQGGHVIVTSRPHTLSHLQGSRWFLSLPKRMVSLDIQGLSDQGVQSFIHSYVDARLQVSCEGDESSKPSKSDEYNDDEETEDCDDNHGCHSDCPCQPLQLRARSDAYIFSLATNPFYLWLMCTIFSEAGEAFIPRTLTQLYTWVMLVFANRWQNSSLHMTTHLDNSTVDFLLSFAHLCYHLVKSGNIKMAAVIHESNKLRFPALGDVAIDQERAESFGLMTIREEGNQLECEFRHLSLAEYLTALHVHVSGEGLNGFPRDRKELILQYLSGLASSSVSRDQMVVKEFLLALGSCADSRDSLDYLKAIQRMRGEWYDRQGLQKQLLFMRCVFESRQSCLELYPFPGLKVINIRGSALLALDLIVIGNFVAKLSDNHRLLELALRDYPLDERGLHGLLPAVTMIRTVTLCARKLMEPDIYRQLASAVHIRGSRSRLRELWLLDVPPAKCATEESDDTDALGKALDELREVCRLNNVRCNIRHRDN